LLTEIWSVLCLLAYLENTRIISLRLLNVVYMYAWSLSACSPNMFKYIQRIWRRFCVHLTTLNSPYSPYTFKYFLLYAQNTLRYFQHILHMLERNVRFPIPHECIKTDKTDNLCCALQWQRQEATEPTVLPRRTSIKYCDYLPIFRNDENYTANFSKNLLDNQL
jgi:hypothetical protein